MFDNNMNSSFPRCVCSEELCYGYRDFYIFSAEVLPFSIPPHFRGAETKPYQVFTTFQDITEQSYGILGMRERVYALNGKFSIEGEPGKGTRIEVELPLPERSPHQNMPQNGS